MAQQTPKGIAKRAVINVKRTVPIIGVKIPPFVIPSEGTFEINSHDKEDAPFDTISQIMTMRKKHTISVVDKSVPHSITDDNLLVLYCMILSKTVYKKFSDQIGKQRHKEQYGSNGV